MGILDGKVALITGAAGKKSMGHAIALRLAAEGADIVLIDKKAIPENIHPADKGWAGLEDIVKEVNSLGREALAVIADITNSKEIDSAITGVLQKLKKIDILVHCAAVRGPVTTPVTELAEEDWQKVTDVNLKGSFLISRAVARSMVAAGKPGKILLFASMGGVKGMPGSAAYCASKFGVIGLVKSLALDLAKNSINVNAINPGAVATNLRDAYHEGVARAEGIEIEEARQRDYKKHSAGIHMGRVGTTAEIADLVLFLVSDHSNYITGEAINIAGGVN